ncbi:phosphate/phosphite/phosphonate ABC transporter substrate-binding protein [Lactobacillus mulieris]|jgi:phosphate/phosphite/phosphonate ABC transporters, periplasmic binding protein|uniref:Phosphate/phosphite/phosphonate ABC transporter substrate-binding protein n=1 Tax=Lactobacillus mulieris TaxID=2508708 RepID=A0AAP3M427_9LACO|nr:MULTISPECIES: phosphate/phosphite/phosphonate ABC transporter substrate-binding protein [Lactobacillus]EFH30131.1 phosphate/phosphite/phosphonate ABC transporter, periplasmic binding protein [Lactobacillus jensenii JV-V16]KAA9244290.1 phosphate/phosphite/phosphonate ABC transporter substrate-binding protein [Lactobacillus jensenii]MCW8123733.1 phosphate/phosphite/phosphonate ABC transporter substrate-binding protein [Lactobacillus mulieris]MCZ3845119.1 phosphate/phosphite/phosphonate ABC tra
MKFKKIVVGALALLTAAVATACSSNNSSKGSSSTDYTPKKVLNVQFVPSSQASTLEAKAKPLESLLKKELGIPVKVTVSTSNNALVEAMSSHQVDVGFLPPDAYVLAHKRKIADVLLQAERYGYDEPSGKMNKTLMDKYRAMIVVKKGSKIKSWKDLKGKKIAVQESSSTSGYVYPVAELYKKGLNVVKDSTLTQVQGHDQAVLAVYNGDVDAAFVFADARNIAAKDTPQVMKDVVPIYFTKWIPNDTISVRSDMSQAYRTKLKKAFKNLMKTEKGKKIMSSIYSHMGYKDSKDSNFDVIRDYEKTIEKVTK